MEDVETGIRIHPHVDAVYREAVGKTTRAIVARLREMEPVYLGAHLGPVDGGDVLDPQSHEKRADVVVAGILAVLSDLQTQVDELREGRK